MTPPICNEELKTMEKKRLEKIAELLTSLVQAVNGMAAREL
jgi:hypothetical protein